LIAGIKFQIFAIFIKNLLHCEKQELEFSL